MGANSHYNRSQSSHLLVDLLVACVALLLLLLLLPALVVLSPIVLHCWCSLKLVIILITLSACCNVVLLWVRRGYCYPRSSLLLHHNEETFSLFFNTFHCATTDTSLPVKSAHSDAFIHEGRNMNEKSGAFIFCTVSKRKSHSWEVT